MRTVHKTTLFLVDRQAISLPGSDAKFLRVAEQHGALCLWSEVDPGKPTQAYEAAVVGTGRTVPEEFEFVETVLMANGELVWHVYIRRC